MYNWEVDYYILSLSIWISSSRILKMKLRSRSNYKIIRILVVHYLFFYLRDDQYISDFQTDRLRT